MVPRSVSRPYAETAIGTGKALLLTPVLLLADLFVTPYRVLAGGKLPSGWVPGTSNRTGIESMGRGPCLSVPGDPCFRLWCTLSRHRNLSVPLRGLRGEICSVQTVVSRSCSVSAVGRHSSGHRGWLRRPGEDALLCRPTGGSASDLLMGRVSPSAGRARWPFPAPAI